jgi:hypothetical protein
MVVKQRAVIHGAGRPDVGRAVAAVPQRKGLATALVKFIVGAKAGGWAPGGDVDPAE